MKILGIRKTAVVEIAEVVKNNSGGGLRELPLPRCVEIWGWDLI